MSSRVLRVSARVGAMAAFVLIAVAAPGTAAAARQAGATDRAALRSRIESRYEILALRDGIGLRPKNARAGVRMIEISGGEIAIDGVSVSGRELRDRLGPDADLVIPLSYLDAAERRAFLEPGAARPVEPPPPATPPAPEPRAEPERRSRPSPAPRSANGRRHVGERVRIFGGVTVPADEWVDGQVVAVLGSVRVDGHVADQIVAVLGSVELGPEAVVEGDVISVGGRIHRADGAQINGRITEVNFPGGSSEFGWQPWYAGPMVLGGLGGTARLMGTVFRLFILGLLGSIVLLLVPRPVERIAERVRAEPVKMTLIGLVAQLLFFPALILTVLVLALSIIGIPLLVLVPFALLALLFVMLGGFTGVAHAVGGWGASRAGWDPNQRFPRLWLGILLVLTPLLIARFFGIISGPFNLAALLLAMLAVFGEYLLWTAGFGAALATGLERWRARRGEVQYPPNTP